MKSSHNEETLALLSKSTVKLLRVRNAIDDGTLKKESQMLQKQRKAEERLYQRTKGYLLQQRSKICETRPLSSRSLNVEQAVTKWKSDPNLTRQNLSPQLRRKEIAVNRGRQIFLSSSFPHLTDDTDRHSGLSLSPRSRHRVLSSISPEHGSVTTSLPDLNAASKRKRGGKKISDSIRAWKLSDTDLDAGRSAFHEVATTDEEWKELRNCRYLRTLSAGKELSK